MPVSHHAAAIREQLRQQLPGLLSITAAAEYMGIPRSTAYMLIKQDRFPVKVRQVGGRKMVSRIDIENYLDSRSDVA